MKKNAFSEKKIKKNCNFSSCWKSRR